MNTLIVIGYTGTKRAYLNVDEDTAIERYLESEGMIYSAEDRFEEERRAHKQMKMFTFDDEFNVYDAWGD